MATAAELMGQETDSDETPDLSITTEVADTTPETSAPEQETEQDDAPKVGKDGRVRDGKGKYTKVIDDIDGPGDLEREIEFTTTDPAAKPDEAAAAETPVAEAPKDEPWEFYGRGKTVTIPGALYRKGVGVFIPEKAGDVDVLGDIRARLVRAESLPEIQQRSEQYRQQVERGYTQHSLENAAMKEAFGGFLSVDGLTKLLTDAQKFGVEPVAKELMLALKGKQYEIADKLKESGAPMVGAPEQASGGQMTDSIKQQAYRTLEDEFETMVRDKFPGLSAQEKHSLAQSVADIAPATWFEQALTDDPHGRWSKGDIAVKRGVLETFIRGTRTGHTPAAAPSAPPVSSARPVVSTPVKAPPSGAGAVTNIAGKGSVKPRPNGSFANKADFERWRKSNAID